MKYLVQSKIIGVNCYFCCSHSGSLFHPEFCFLLKPGVYCQAKRQNKLEKKHLSVFFPEEQQNRKKVLAYPMEKHSILIGPLLKRHGFSLFKINKNSLAVFVSKLL